MLNLILTIIAIPFLPVFMYGATSAGANQAAHNQPAAQEVLGETSQKNSDGSLCESDGSQGFQNHKLFPLSSSPTAFVPKRKSDYADITLFAGATAVIDVDSGTLLEYSRGRKERQIASLTKVMTATLTLESVKDLDSSVVTITPEMLDVDGTKVGCPTSVFCNDQRLVPGEKITVRNLMKAMLLDSANDAATALGIYVGGSKQGFVDMMNKKAKSLGLQDTHFCTPSGLEIDGHEDECYSSAYDIARIAAYSLKYDWLWSIMRTKELTVTSVDGKYVHHLRNTDELLGQLPECIGGKTGFTPLAGKSLLLGAVDPTGKHRIIAVILDDPNLWSDMRKLVNWTFDNYEWR